MSGGAPGMAGSRRPRSVVTVSPPSRPSVYGCRGWRMTASVGPDSTKRPAYMTASRSAISTRHLKGHALVHQGQHLRLDRLQQLGRVAQGGADTLGAEDGQAVAGNHERGVEGGHAPAERRPTRRDSAGPLRIAGIRGGPDEEIARSENLSLRDPAHDRVLGLAAGVAKLEGQRARRKRQPIVELDVRIAVLIRPAKALGRELGTGAG